MKMGLSALGVVLAGLLGAPAMAAPAAPAAAREQLRCLDDRLNDSQRASIALLFAEQPEDPKDDVVHPRGSASAALDFGYALSSCASQFGWDQPRQGIAAQYLLLDGRLSRIKLKHSAAWNSTLERIAPIYAPLVPPETKPAEDDKPQQEAAESRDSAMVVANVIANSQGAVSSTDTEDVIAFLRIWLKREKAGETFR